MRSHAEHGNEDNKNKEEPAMLTKHHYSAFFLPVFVVLLSFGCTPSPPPTIRLSVICNGNHPSPEFIEGDIVVPIAQQIIGVEGLSSLTGVSSAGRAEIYVHGNPGVDAVNFRNRIADRIKLAIPLLPSQAKIDKVEDVTEQAYPPTITVKNVDNFRVDIDPKIIARLGIRISDVTDSIKRFNWDDKTVPPDLNKIFVKSLDGKEHPLSDFAKMTVSKEPDHRIYRLPPTEKQ